MSKQQTEDELAFPDFKPGDAWGESITKQRASVLEKPVQRWEAEEWTASEERGERTRPFAGHSLNGADVFWLAVRTELGNSDPQALSRGAEYILREATSTEMNRLHLEGAQLDFANLEGAALRAAHLEKARLSAANLEGAVLIDTHLEGALLDGANLSSAKLSSAHLEGAVLAEARLKGAWLFGTHLEGAILSAARLEGAILDDVHLEGADLREAHLEGASLKGVHLEGKPMPVEEVASLRSLWMDNDDMDNDDIPALRNIPNMLPPANLQQVFFDSATSLNNVTFGSNESGYVSLADVRWGDVNRAVIDWTHATPGFLGLRTRLEAIELGDEREAHSQTSIEGKPKTGHEWLEGYKVAVRANRQLATALRQQGLNEDADRFAYKAQKLQRQVLRRQRRYGGALGSWFLDIIAGYGYKPLRSLIAYVVIVGLFAGAYLLNAQFAAPHLTWDEALVLSISAFHGRGFFTSGISLGDTLARLAAGEAIIGLLIEIIFIATFTQRFFAR